MSYLIGHTSPGPSKGISIVVFRITVHHIGKGQLNLNVKGFSNPIFWTKTSSSMGVFGSQILLDENLQLLT